MLSRDDWLPLARKLDWDYSYVREDEVFPEVISGRPWLPHSEWKDWEELFKTSYREYVDNQYEKDMTVYAVRDAVGRLENIQKLAAPWINSLNIYLNDVLGNVNGGLRRGFIDQGLLVYNMTVDFEKLIGWQGLSLYTNGFLIHNTGRIRRDYVGGINTIAAIEAVPTGRLSELWLEQSLWNGGASLRAGQLAADAEFFFADAGLMFLQTDRPTITAAALPSGGPAYPLSTPGVRVKVEPNKNLSVLAAVYNGDPAGPGTPGDEQLRNKYGVNFRLKDSPFVIAEAQFRTNQGKTDTGLASTLKLGAWTHFGKFDDNRFADDGTLLADPVEAKGK